MKDRKEYTKRYNDDNYDQFTLRLRKGEKERLKKKAESLGQSLNDFINKAIYTQVWQKD